MASMGEEASKGRDKWEGPEKGGSPFMLTAAGRPLTPEGGSPRDHAKDQRSVVWGFHLIVGGGILKELAFYATREVATARKVHSGHPSTIGAGH
jgi:hypothetical protein